jgi:predicted NBD/HSP70 family sugar kinase
MSVLAIDIGGTNIKILATGQKEPRKFPSGEKMTPKQMVAGVKRLAGDWQYDVVSIGYPGIVKEGRLVTEPNNLAPGWVGFDFERAFRRPVKLMNDAAMQALGSYQGGVMLFLGLGTGLGSALVVNRIVVPMELGRLSYKDGSIEDYLGRQGLKRLGRKTWERLLAAVAMRLSAAIHLDDLVVGGGNAKKLTYLPTGCRVGSNANAFVGGFRMWKEEERRRAAAPARNAATKKEAHKT